jgi:pyruvate dehydrogenase E2 component (dihydrolipoamide acetyltransferase)
MTTYEFKLPDIGEGVVEGEIVKWLVKAGETVAEDQPLVEVMTDKATVTIPSPKKGKVIQTHGNEGDIAKVHQTLVTLELQAGGSSIAPSAESRPAAGAVAPKPIAARSEAETPTVARKAAETPTVVRNAAETNGGPQSGRVLATPVTRRMAREHGLQIDQISGSGPQGRVTKADVMVAMGQGAGAAPVAARSARPAALTASRDDQRIPLKGLRRRVAEKMVRSKFTAPHYTFVEEMDASALVAVRQRLNEAIVGSGRGSKISYLPFICKALVAAMKKFPTLNANFDEATQELIVRGAYNFGIAAATEEGLTVPVVKDVDRLSLQELATEIARLGTAAREKKLKIDELSGGTFTITSLGEKSGLLATPIINHPEVAILGVHRIRKRPVVLNDQIAIREMMYLSLSFDHRNIDGAVGAEFTYALIDLLEHPELLMLELR